MQRQGESGVQRKTTLRVSAGGLDCKACVAFLVHLGKGMGKHGTSGGGGSGVGVPIFRRGRSRLLDGPLFSIKRYSDDEKMTQCWRTTSAQG